MAAIGIEAVEDLARQFAGRAQHQYAAGLGLRAGTVFQQAMQDRKCERRGLAGAGLGDANDIAAGEGDGNGLGLDGGGRDVVFVFEGTREWIGEAEILKGGQKGIFL